MAIQLHVAMSLWEKCVQDVLHVVTGSVRCLLCPSIAEKLLSNNSTPYIIT